jgi:hypothetical protein
MSMEYTPDQDKQARDEGNWASTSTLRVGKAPTGALNLNVEGRHTLSPLQGFGQLWQKTFRVRLEGTSITPAEVVKEWKANFPKFWPKWQHYYLPGAGIKPGEVALINLIIPGDSPVGLPVSTGVQVIYADDESFTFTTPEGHIFAGWNTFSAYTDDDGCTVAQIQLYVRANDFAIEMGFRLGANRSETKMWQGALTALAADFGVTGTVETEIVCLDPRLQWSQFWNIWQNAAIRTFFYRVLTPFRVVMRKK